MAVETAAMCSGVVRIYWTATGEVQALRGVDALFDRGAVTAVVGPSGSGNSSLLRILAGMDRPTAGTVMIEGEDLAEMTPGALRRLRKRSIGYVFQRPSDNLIPYLTAAEHVGLATRLRESDIDGGLLERLGIGNRRDHRPAELSGGEQQRLAFAQAAAGEPPLIVADEPTAELDGETARALLDSVSSLTSEGSSIVIATHDPQVVRAADRVIELRHGAVASETHRDRTLSVIDESGRIQLPPQAVDLFPGRRAAVRIVDGEIRITPP